MRFCLECRRLAGPGPICTSCGRSFGGRLCSGKKRHLNPPHANVCGYCGSTSLLESARSLPLGCVSHSLIWAGLLLLGSYLGPSLWGGAGALFTATTGYRDPLVWLVDHTIRFFIFFGLLYWGAGLLPGGLGKGLQNLLWKSFSTLMTLGTGLLKRMAVGTAQVIYRAIEGTKDGKK